MRNSISTLVRAQARAAAVLGATLGVPGTALLERRRNEPLTHDDVLAHVPVTVVRPNGSPPWPTLVFMNGATPDGRAHPMVLRLSAALARTGRRVFIPDLPGIAGGELSPATLAAASSFVEAAADLDETAHERVALAGVSVGASLALLTAADRKVADRVSAVAGVAPYSDLANVMLLATTGTYRDEGKLMPYPVPPYLAVGLARSLAAMLPPTPATATLCDELRSLDPALATARDFREHTFRDAGDAAVTLFDLLSNRDAARFDDLYAALPAQIRATAKALSPLHVASRLQAPVELATAPRDRYFPVAESRALTASSPYVRLTVTSLLAHATPRLSPRYLAELGQLNGFFVRALAAAG